MTQSNKRKGRTTDMWHSIARKNKKINTKSIVSRENNESENDDIEEYQSDCDYYSISESDDSTDSDTQETDRDDEREEEEEEERDDVKQGRKVEEKHINDHLKGQRQGARKFSLSDVEGSWTANTIASPRGPRSISMSEINNSHKKRNRQLSLKQAHISTLPSISHKHSNDIFDGTRTLIPTIFSKDEKRNNSDAKISLASLPSSRSCDSELEIIPSNRLSLYKDKTYSLPSSHPTHEEKDPFMIVGRAEHSRFKTAADRLAREEDEVIKREVLNDIEKEEKGRKKEEKKKRKIELKKIENALREDMRRKRNLKIEDDEKEIEEKEGNEQEENDGGRYWEKDEENEKDIENRMNDTNEKMNGITSLDSTSLPLPSPLPSPSSFPFPLLNPLLNHRFHRLPSHLYDRSLSVQSNDTYCPSSISPLHSRSPIIVTSLKDLHLASSVSVIRSCSSSRSISLSSSRSSSSSPTLSPRATRPPSPSQSRSQSLSLSLRSRSLVRTAVRIPIDSKSGSRSRSGSRSSTRTRTPSRDLGSNQESRFKSESRSGSGSGSGGGKRDGRMGTRTGTGERMGMITSSTPHNQFLPSFDNFSQQYASSNLGPLDSRKMSEGIPFY